MLAATKTSHNWTYFVHQFFNPESVKINIDMALAVIITNNIKNFLDKPVKELECIIGLSGAGSVTYKGMIEWYIDDDQGKTHQVKLKNIYQPSLPLQDC